MHKWPFCDGTKAFNKVNLIGFASTEMQYVYIVLGYFFFFLITPNFI